MLPGDPPGFGLTFGGGSGAMVEVEPMLSVCVGDPSTGCQTSNGSHLEAIRSCSLPSAS